MNIVYILVPIALALALSMLGAFVWAARSGQYEDLETPKFRILVDTVPDQNFSEKGKS